MRVIQCFGEREVPAPLLAAHRPHGLRGPHPQRFQQPVDRPDILDRRDVRVVDHREREARAAGESLIRGHRVRSGLTEGEEGDVGRVARRERRGIDTHHPGAVERSRDLTQELVERRIPRCARPPRTAATVSAGSGPAGLRRHAGHWRW